MPVLLDRIAYRLYRRIECNPNQAIGQLIREEAFQNYQVVECLASEKRDEDKAKRFRDLKDAGDESYDARIMEQLSHFNDDVSDCLFWWLQRFAEEQRYGYRLNQDDRRTDREIETDVLAVLIQLCDLDTPAQARKVSKMRLRVLFGDREPWLSDNANSTHYGRWAREAARKTADILPVIDALQEMALGRLNGQGFAKKLNRDLALQRGVRALAKDERDYLSMDRDFVELASLRERVRKSNTPANSNRAESFALEIARAFLESIGVFFRIDGEGRNRIVNYAVPLIPESWNFDQMKAKLKHRKALLEVLPINVAHIQRKLDGDGYITSTIGVCRGCRLFDAACCAVGHSIDWAEEGIETLGIRLYDHCDDFHPIRQARAA